MTKTLLLTGAGGFLGSHILAQVLDKTAWNVVAVDSFRHNGGTDQILEAMAYADMEDGFIQPDTRQRVRLARHDLGAPFTGRQREDIGYCDYVIHAAAESSVDRSISNPVSHVRNNVESTLTMLELAREIEPERYVHISTDEVFGPRTIADEDQHSPSSPYAASKAAAEDLTQAWRRTYGVPATIVNSANLFGERQSQLAFIPSTIRKIIQGERIVIHTQGPQGDVAWRNYTYAPNLAEHLVALVQKPDPESRYLVPGQMGISVLKLASAIAEILGKKLDYELQDGAWTRPGFDGAYAPMVGQGWSPEEAAMTGLKNTVEWYAENPRWLLDV